MEFFKPGRTFDFMKARVFWIPFSLLLVFLSTVFSLWPWPHVWPHGPNYGTDFQGGTEIEVALTKPLQFGGDLDAAALRRAVEQSGFSTPDVVQVGDPSKNQFLVRVQDVSVIDDANKDKIRHAMCITSDPKAPVADPVACPSSARATE